jgi:beta-glucosidase
MSSASTGVPNAQAPTSSGAERPWTDPSKSLDERVEALLGRMTLEEKLAQLGSVWGDHEASGVAPMQDIFTRTRSYDELTKHGLGHLTRVFGTRPVAPAEGAARLGRLQRGLLDNTRLGVPAIAHEECLTGFTTLGATVFPTALAWGATFDPGIVERLAHAIGAGMRAVGVHQGLSPVLDVVVDYRWGRVEETIGEDPYLVGLVGSAYVRGLESAGIIATPKHFAGYSASRAGRNHAPVSMGPREFADVILPPFEMALREGGARSIMHSYADVDGVPPAGNQALLTGMLRDQWGFPGVVVSDYWGVAFLAAMHRVAGSTGGAGARALAAGVDVELPDTLCYGEELAELVRADTVPAHLVDRAARRVLLQKAELGLLDAEWSPEPTDSASRPIDLDPPGNRTLAREVAERSVVLLSNRAALLPLEESVGSIAVVGPCADDPLTFLGCYSYPNHVLHRYPELGTGIDVPPLVAAVRTELPRAIVTHQPGCPIKEADRSGFAAAVDAARSADVCVAAVGDLAGLFGRGTSGEGCDAEELSLPGVQDDLLEALLATGTPLVLVVISGRPYALGAYADRAAAIVQSFFPGEEGGTALARVLTGPVVPSGKLPVQVPRARGGGTGTYLHPPLGGYNRGISVVDPSPLFPFGHGLSYTTFDYADLRLSAAKVPADGELDISCLVRNTGDHAGAEVVQLYLDDPVAQVARPIIQLAGFARVPLEPGQQARVTFRLHADRTSFTGVDLRRVVEPGLINVLVGGSSQDVRLRSSFEITGEPRVVGHDRVLTTPAEVHVEDAI